MRLLCWALLPVTALAAAKYYPKNNIQPVGSQTLLSTLTPPPETIETRAAAFVGSCSPTTPFVFKVNGGSGRGAIGCTNPVASISKLTSGGASDGEIVLHADKKQKNFFALADDRQYYGFPFRYDNVTSQGVDVTVECDADTGIVLLMRDESTFDGVFEVTTDPGDSNSTDTIELVGKAKGRVSKIVAESFQGKSLAKNGKKTKVTNKDNDRFDIEAGSVGDIVLLHMESLDDNNNLIQRTIVKKNKPRKPQPFKLHIGKAYINTDNSDVVIPFQGQPVNQGSFLKLSARVGLEVDGALISEEIDVTSIQEGGTAALTLHKAWIGRALELRNLTENDNFDLVVTEAVATDPHNGYQIIGLLDGPVVLNLKKNKRRRHLAATPTPEEREITEEMMMGRRPDIRQLMGGQSTEATSGANPHNLRHLQVNGRSKIIVHGYCSTGDTFPLSQFSPSSEYRHTFTTAAQGLSNINFAADVYQYTQNKGITSCGIIGHSQGGLVALTLYTHWFSCLDYSTSGTRLIQSVGSPYQGSPLAGSLADLGTIFGYGCGSVYDITTSGAPVWLSGIPSWAQNKAYYYTAEYADIWWGNDYCSLASDALLTDPEDGATEDYRARLPYGNYMGLTTGQCHTKDMRDPYECSDASRNAIMNANAKY